MCVDFNFTSCDNVEGDHFISSTTPCHVIMGNFNQDIGASCPSRPWQEGLDDANPLDPPLSPPPSTLTWDNITRESPATAGHGV